LDATKVWPEELLPIRYIGELQLNKNIEEYFTQVEQAAFCTSHLVPGIGFSNDPLLQGRNFSYQDTQLSRLGVNWQELPINRPVCPVMNHHRDGQLRHRITPGKINYWPNRHSIAPPATHAEGAYIEYPEKIEAIKQRLHSKKFSEHFSQAQLFYNSLAPHEKAHIIAALSFELDHCDDPVVYERMVERLCDIDLKMAQAVAEKVGAPSPKQSNRPNHGLRAKGLSQLDFTPEALGLNPTIATRMVGILIADGFNYSEYETVKAALTAAGAFVYTIGPRRQPVIPSSGGKGVFPEHHFEAFRSTGFDTLYIPGGDHVATLLKNGRVIHWVREAFGHLKAIGATGEGVALVREACGVPGMDFSTSTDVMDSYGVVTAGGVGDGPSSMGEGLKMMKGAKNFMDAYAYNIAQHRNYQRELDGLASMVAF
jgi:catalase